MDAGTENVTIEDIQKAFRDCYTSVYDEQDGIPPVIISSSPHNQVFNQFCAQLCFCQLTARFASCKTHAQLFLFAS